MTSLPTFLSLFALCNILPSTFSHMTLTRMARQPTVPYLGMKVFPWIFRTPRRPPNPLLAGCSILSGRRSQHSCSEYKDAKNGVHVAAKESYDPANKSAPC
jgi:hypothetical protein